MMKCFGFFFLSSIFYCRGINDFCRSRWHDNRRRELDSYTGHKQLIPQQWHRYIDHCTGPRQHDRQQHRHHRWSQFNQWMEALQQHQRQTPDNWTEAWEQNPDLTVTAFVIPFWFCSVTWYHSLTKVMSPPVAKAPWNPPGLRQHRIQKFLKVRLPKVSWWLRSLLYLCLISDSLTPVYVGGSTTDSCTYVWLQFWLSETHCLANSFGLITTFFLGI